MESDCMKIEVPTINDYEQVNDLACQVHELHVNWRPDLFLSTKEAIAKERFVNLIEEKSIFVVKIEDKIVGYVTFCIVEKENPILRFRKQLSIDDMCVDNKYRGQGIGSSLLKFIEKYAKEANCTDIYLTVNEENTNAIKTYEKFGMKVKNIAYSKQIK